MTMGPGGGAHDDAIPAPPNRETKHSTGINDGTNTLRQYSTPKSPGKAMAGWPNYTAAGPPGSRYDHWSWMPKHEAWEVMAKFMENAALAKLAI